MVFFFFFFFDTWARPGSCIVTATAALNSGSLDKAYSFSLFSPREPGHTFKTMAQLSQEEIDACREAFIRFDKDRTGRLGAEELRLVLESLGQSPGDEEVFLMISNVSRKSF